MAEYILTLQESLTTQDESSYVSALTAVAIDMLQADAGYALGLKTLLNDTYPLEVLSDSPVAYYRLHDTTGTADDASPNNRDATYAGGYTQSQASLVPSQAANNAITLNGTTGYIQLPASLRAALTGASAISLELTVKPGTSGVERVLIVIEGQAATSSGARLRLSSSDYLQANCLPATGQTNLTLTASDSVGHKVLSGETAHVVMVADIANDIILLYKNGVMIKSGQPAPLWTGTYGVVEGTTHGKIGTNLTGSSWHSGRVDDVAVYASALSEAQVGKHYSAWLSGKLSSDEIHLHAKFYDYAIEMTRAVESLSSAGSNYNHTLIAAVQCGETLSWLKAVLGSLTETINTTTTTRNDLAILISETLAVMAATNSGGSLFGVSAAEILSLRERLLVSWIVLAQESVTLTSPLTFNAPKLRTVIERVRLSGVVDSRLGAAASVAVALLLQEAVSSGKGANAIESLTMTATMAVRIKALAAVVEQAVFSTVAERRLSISVPLTERVIATAGASSAAVLLDLLSEGVTFNLSFGLGDETYTGWVMNTRNFGVTEYQDYPFNSLAKFGGVYLGANANGLYRLDGSDDAGADIDWRIQTGSVAFPHLANVDEAWLALRADGTMLLKTLTADKVERWYEVRGTGEMHNQRVKMAKGVSSGFWQFELTGTTDFRLDGLELFQITFRR